MHPALKSLLALLLAAVVLVACGGGRSEQQGAYVAAVERSGGQLKQSMSAVGDGADPTGTPKGDARLLERYRAAVVKTRRELAGLDVPDEAGTAHRALLAALDDYEAVLRRGAADLVAAGPDSVPEARERLVVGTERAGEEIDAALRSIGAALRGGS